MTELLLEKIEALLPQTQCGRCDHPGCTPYAQALVDGTDTINKCAPGGHATMLALSELLGKEPLALDDERLNVSLKKQVAYIDPMGCIGCTLCIRACPIDAIIGANKLLHTVVEASCTGCELCLISCPTQCIVMAPDKTDAPTWVVGDIQLTKQAQKNRVEHDTKQARLALEEEKSKALRDKRTQKSRIKTDLNAALIRAQEKRDALVKGMNRENNHD